MSDGEEAFDDRLTDYLVAYQEGHDGRDPSVSIGLDTTSLSPEAQIKLDGAKLCIDLLQSLRTDYESGDARTDDRVFKIDLPRRIGRFEVIDFLGSGGFGIVYRASDPRTNRLVALKVPRLEALASTELRARFEKEALAAARLDHPNIVAVLEAGIDGLMPYIASRYYEGPTLAAWLRQHPSSSPRQAAEFIAQLARAVEHAHAFGVLHRDIKPSNILLLPVSHGSEIRTLCECTPKLMDFGLAKLADSTQEMTETGARLGTVRYMPPEQAAGRKLEIGPTVDVYSLGAVLYELLAGQPPFAADSDLEVLRLVQDDEPSRLHTRHGAVSRDLETICLKCLEKRPADRYPSAAALGADLDRFLSGQPIAARSIAPWERFVRWTKRYPAWASLIAVIVLGTLGLIVGLNRSNTRIRAERDRATASELRTREYAYCADMKLAQDAWENLSADECRRLLERYIPRPGEQDIRRLEWHILWRTANESSEVVVQQPAGVWSMAVGYDERLLATGGRDGKARLWSLETGKLLHEMVASARGNVDCVRFAFRKDAPCLVTAGDDATIRVWRVDDGSLVTELKGHEEWIGALALSSPHDGFRWLMTGDGQGRVLLWDFVNKTLIRELFRQPAPVRQLLYVERRWLVSICESEIRVWDLEDNKYPDGLVDGKLELPANNSFWRFGAYDTPNHRLISQDKVLGTWDFSQERFGELTVVGPASKADSMELLEPTKLLLEGGMAPDWNVYVRRLDQLDQVERVFKGHSGAIRALEGFPRSDEFFSGSADGTVRRWKLNVADPSRRSIYMGDGIDALVWTRDGRHLYLGTHHGQIWHVGESTNWGDREVGTLGSPARAMAISDNDTTLYTVDINGGIMRRVNDGPLQPLPYRVEPTIDHLALAGGNRVLCYSRDKLLVAVDPESGRELWRHEYPMSVNSLYPLQDTIFIARHDGVIQCLDVLSGKLLQESDRDLDPVKAIDVSVDRTRLAAVTANRKVRIYYLPTLQLLKQFAYVKEMAGVFFTADDERLVIVDANQLYLFNPRTGQTVLVAPTGFPALPLARSTDRKSIAGHSGRHLRIIQLERE